MTGRRKGWANICQFHRSSNKMGIMTVRAAKDFSVLEVLCQIRACLKPKHIPQWRNISYMFMKQHRNYLHKTGTAREGIIRDFNKPLINWSKGYKMCKESNQ